VRGNIKSYESVHEMPPNQIDFQHILGQGRMRLSSGSYYTGKTHDAGYSGQIVLTMIRWGGSGREAPMAATLHFLYDYLYGYL
jgi:hypothetical protein